jgi:hypothetical protein
MKTSLLLPVIFASACATMSGGGKGSTAPFQGEATVNKRRAEISDAGKVAMDCMKSKEAATSKGGVFAVSADAAGKLSVTPVSWNGPESVKQCIVDAGTKATVTPLPGPAVGVLWEFSAPGEKPEPAKAPDDFAVKMQPLVDTMHDEVAACGTRHLGVDFPATIDVWYFIAGDGKAYAPTVTGDDSKDGSFEACVQDVVTKTKFPVTNVEKPFGTTAHFKIGVYGDTQRSR